MSPKRARKFGLIGTITKDFITSDPAAGPEEIRLPDQAGGAESVSGAVPVSGQEARAGLGGVLYQAGVLCGLNEDVHLHTVCGQELRDEVQSIIRNWPTLYPSGIRTVPGPGNRVRLHYPEKGERLEILESVGPGLDPAGIFGELPLLDFLILVVNSGHDIAAGDWQKIVRGARCPAWLDVHSLPLTPVLHVERRYRALPGWRDWAEGVAYLQANRKEVACMLGRPDEAEGWPSADSDETIRFADAAFEIGVRAVFLTLGKDGASVMTPGVRKIIPSLPVDRLADTTGCGDVFCAATATKLARGEDPFEAAAFGVRLASRAAAVLGIEATFYLARQFGGDNT